MEAYLLKEGAQKPPALGKAAIASPEIGDHAQIGGPPGLHPKAFLLLSTRSSPV